MNKLVLITSIIKPPLTTLSYAVRSVYTDEQRYIQTQQTISSVKEKIPDAKILFVECSELLSEEHNYIINNCDYFINLYNDINLRQNIHSQSKSLGEGTMTYCAIKYIENNNIEFDILIKISGRYWLSDQFNYELFNNGNTVIKYINNDIHNVFTALYKLPKNIAFKFANYLQNNVSNMMKCVGFEVLFAGFIQQILMHTNIISVDPIGLAGYVSVSGEYYHG